MRPTTRALIATTSAAALMLGAAACSSDSDEASTGGTGGGGASGAINVSGSSTVKPITQRVAELWEDEGASAEVTVDGPGTGDGFKLFCSGETDISDASRPIKASEAEDCKDNGIEFIELKVAIDGLAAMTNPDNADVACLNFEDLYAIVGPESEGFNNWSQAGALAAELGSDTSFPDLALTVTAPGAESGTYDTFIELALDKILEARVEEGKVEADADGDPVASTRKDYSSQANDNAIIQGIVGSVGSFGWVGYSYAVENADSVKLIEIDGGDGCVAATPDTIASNEYPLARDLYIYVNADRVDGAVGEFVDFFLTDAGMAAVAEVGYVDLTGADVEATRAVWAAKETGTRDGGS